MGAKRTGFMLRSALWVLICLCLCLPVYGQELELALFRRSPQETVAFHVENMLPGDSVSQVFRVRVSHRGEVTLHFAPRVLPGGEKLGEVLQCRVTLDGEEDPLYVGLMANAPESLDVLCPAEGKRNHTELCYRVTAFLDTSVGNEYQGKELSADLLWWVEEEEELADPPYTGAKNGVVLWALLLAVALGGSVVVLLVIRKRGDDSDERK